MSDLPLMCQLCQSIERVEPISAESPANNKCFEAMQYTESYRPFNKDRRAIQLTCDNFSHIKTAVLGLRRGGRMVLRASPEMPKIELSNLGPLFEKKD